MPAYLFLRRLRRSPAAFCGLIVIALLLLIALFAPWLAPLDPNWQDAAARLQGRAAALARHRQLWPRPALKPDLRRPSGAGAGGAGHGDYAPAGLLVGILSGYYGGWLERV
jgi:peptide/nickel transport system permease protein